MVSIIMAFCVITGLSSCISPKENLPKSGSYIAVENQYSFDELPHDGSRDVYEKLKSSVFSTPSSETKEFCTIKTDDDLSETQIYLGYRAFIDDHPEVFWLSCGTYNKGLDFETTYFQFSSLYSAKDLATMKSDFNGAIESFFNNVSDNLNQEELEKYAHDYIIENCEYDYNALDKDGNSDSKYKKYNEVHSAYGALVDRKAVCSGYAKTYKILLNRLGVDCVLIYGKGKSLEDEKFKIRTGEVNHEWNAVKNGSEWRMTDVTWDDVEEESKKYEFFNLSVSEMYSTHQAQQIDINSFQYSRWLNLNDYGDCLFLPK